MYKNSGQIFTKFDHCYKYIPIILQSISSRESTDHERMKLYNKPISKTPRFAREFALRTNKKNEQVWCERKNYTRQDEILR
ncbi:MAG: hypothetical protein SOV27_02870 [Eubacteriales bacterium]|nr:hypothetical protein [Eubacteriales bacterium]